MTEKNSKYLGELFANNRRWAERAVRADPEFFSRLVNQQAPKYLWIGCSDSRVPANEIVDLAPGELFVHRNIANVVVHTDMNCLSVLQYAIEVLHVEHILVVGHYGCGGVARTLQGGMEGVADNWLRHVQDVQWKRRSLLEGKVFGDQVDLLCELNVLEQVSHVCRTTFVRDAWARGEKLVVHGWCYGIKDGLANDLGWSVDGPCDLGVALQSAVDACMQRWNKEA